jgi:predicted DNA-binding protein (MmcQ/YjbR family)
MRLADARKFALSLPETTQQPHFSAASFRVGGKIFATVPPGGTQLRIFVTQDEVEALLDEDASTYERVIWGKRAVPGAVASPRYGRSTPNRTEEHR